MQTEPSPQSQTAVRDVFSPASRRCLGFEELGDDWPGIVSGGRGVAASAVKAPGVSPATGGGFCWQAMIAHQAKAKRAFFKAEHSSQPRLGASTLAADRPGITLKRSATRGS